MNGTE